MALPQVTPYELPTLHELPSARVGWSIQPGRAALLIHDMQEYFLDIYAATSPPLRPLLDNVARLRAACRSARIPVVYTAQPAEQSSADRGLLSDVWGPGVTARPERAGVVDRLRPEPEDTVLVKWRYSAFARSPLREWLREQRRDQLIICGVYAHIGCQVTACEAFMNDIQPFVVGDAVADFNREQHQAALRYVAECCGVALTTELALQRIGPGAHDRTETLRVELAKLLGVPAAEIGTDDDLFELGLDSVRLLALLERFQARGAALDLMDLAATPTVSAWSELLGAAAGESTS